MPKRRDLLMRQAMYHVKKGNTPLFQECAGFVPEIEMGPEQQVLLLLDKLQHAFPLAIPFIQEYILICVDVCPERRGPFSAIQAKTPCEQGIHRQMWAANVVRDSAYSDQLNIEHT